MGLLHTLAEVVSALDGAGVDYMVTGSVASTHYGEPRGTQDVDLVVETTPEALDAFVDSLDRDRFYVGDAARALTDRSMFNVIETASGWKVDLIIRKDRAFSASEFGRRRQVDLGDLTVWMVTVEDAILSKLEWASVGDSDRQRRDAAEMFAAATGSLDEGYLHRWAAELGVAGELARIAGG